VKLSPARIDAVLAAPDPKLRALLFYGPDGGLVRERADMVTRAIAVDPHDPFRVVELTGAALAADPARLADEAQALSLTGGRRVLRVREAGDGQGALFDRFLRAAFPGDSAIILEAGDLPARSSLRRAFEGSAAAAAIACYADGPREVEKLAREIMTQRRITVSGDALAYLTARLGNDRMVSRQELEKLALYVGDGGRLDEAAAVAAIGDSATLSLDDVVYAAADGDAAGLERALQRAFEEGEAEV
jgi:DNA polymerase III subunit delta